MDAAGLDPSTGFYRLACERCRRHKLRCDWASANPDSSCGRCTRAAVKCEKNTMRRVGRPPRLPPAQRRRTTTTTTTTTTTAPPHVQPQADAHAPPPQYHHDVPDVADLFDLDTSALDFPNNPVQDAVTLTPEATPDVAFDIRGDTAWFDAVVNSTPQLAPAATNARPAGSSPSHTLANPQQLAHLGSSKPAARVPQGAPSYPREVTQSPATENSGPSDARDQPRQLAALNADLFDLLPAAHPQTAARAGWWILLVPKLIAHMKALHRLADEILSADPTRADGLGGEDALADRPTWMVLMSCYVRVIQVCRYSLASIRATLETNRGLLAGLHVEGAMMHDDEPDLKVLLLLQVLKYRLNALATTLGLPDRHRFADPRPGSAAAEAANTSPTRLQTMGTVVDWVLQGDPWERSVFGSPTARKENIAEALQAEFGVLRGMVS